MLHTSYQSISCKSGKFYRIMYRTYKTALLLIGQLDVLTLSKIVSH